MLSPLSLDNDSFSELIEKYRSRIAGVFPDWTNFNLSDPGITFLDLFVWLRENQQYYMEQLGDDHFREFFRLAGFIPYGRQCARVLAEAVFEKSRQAVSIPAGTRFLSGGLSFETTEDEFVPDAVITGAKQMDKDGNTGFSIGRGQLVYQGAYSFSPFGRDAETGACMVIDVSGSIPARQDFRLSVRLQSNGRNPQMDGVSEKLTDIFWEYIIDGVALPLTVVEDETCGLLYSGRIKFCIDNDIPNKYGSLQLRATLRSGAYDVMPVINGMSLSHIVLSQIRSYDFEEGLVLAEGNGFPDQVFRIPQEGFLAESIRIEGEDIWNPGKRVTWTATDDLFSCGPEDMCFVPDESEGVIRFGNGWHGMPPEGRIVLKAVTETAGQEGNIKTGSAFKPEIPLENDIEFSMTALISPGREPETRDETMLRIAREKEKVLRAVTLNDYEQLVMETPGLCIHSCHAWTEEIDSNTVHVVVRPGDGTGPTVLTEQEKIIISRYLEDKRLIGMRIKLHSPSYIRVNVTVDAFPSPSYRDASDILEKEIRQWFEERKDVYGKPMPYDQLLYRLVMSPCIRKLVGLSMEPLNAGITRNKNRALVPPVNGVFLPGRIEIILNQY